MNKILLLFFLLLFGCTSDPITPEPAPIPLNYYDGEWEPRSYHGVYTSDVNSSLEVSITKIVIQNQIIKEVYSTHGERMEIPYKSEKITLIDKIYEADIEVIYYKNNRPGPDSSPPERYVLIEQISFSVIFAPHDEYQIKLGGGHSLYSDCGCRPIPFELYKRIK